MKRILFISSMNGAPWGGSEEFWCRLAMWMAQRGHTVECCFFDWPNGKEEKKAALQAKGCRLHLLPNPKMAKNYLQKLFIKARAKNQLTQLARGDYDLVCINQGGLLDVTYPLLNSLLSFLGKFVIVYHNYNDLNILSEARKRSLYKWSHAALQNIVAAEKIFSVVKKIAEFELPTGTVLINPITIPEQDQPCPWPGLNENGNFLWIVLAELDVERKAQDLLLKTLASEKWKQRNWQLYLYGAGHDRELLSNLVVTLNLEQKVFLKGHTNSVEEVLKSAHLLLQITHMDAMPLSVTEAMNMSRPCIVSNVGDMPLWIRDEEHGYVVPALTEQVIDAVLEKAWGQKHKWQQLGVNAFHHFRQKYPMPYDPYYEDYFISLMKN